jgi:hypothetical protein
MSDDTEIPESHQTSLTHRLAVMKAGRFVWLLIISTSVYAAWSGEWYLIAVAIVSGLIAMALLSIHSANKVKKITGLSQTEQAAIWEQHKAAVRHR